MHGYISWYENRTTGLLKCIKSTTSPRRNNMIVINQTTLHLWKYFSTLDYNDKYENIRSICLYVGAYNPQDDTYSNKIFITKLINLMDYLYVESDIESESESESTDSEDVDIEPETELDEPDFKVINEYKIDDRLVSNTEFYNTLIQLTNPDASSSDSDDGSEPEENPNQPEYWQNQPPNDEKII